MSGDRMRLLARVKILPDGSVQIIHIDETANGMVLAKQDRVLADAIVDGDRPGDDDEPEE